MGCIKNEIKTINAGKKGEHGKDFMKIKFNIDDNLLLNKPLKLPLLTIIISCIFEEDSKLYLQQTSICMRYRMEINMRQKKIKNRPDYLFNDHMIVNIKGFNSSLLEINKLSFKGVFSLNIYYIKYIPTKSPDHVSINKTDNDEGFVYLFLDDADGHIEKNNGIKYLVFTPTEKNK